MKVMVLGASGHVGKQLLHTLAAQANMEVIGTSRSEVARQTANSSLLKIDTLDGKALAAALNGFDAVVNCVAGNPRAISEGASLLVDAALSASCPRIIHLSTMSVYGALEGRVAEDAILDPGLGWYGKAKCEAEVSMAKFASAGGEAVLLRPGCIFGPGSNLWVGRIGRWLQAGRLGDLGIAGDGWSNLVHVDDVCQAIGAALQIRITADARMSAFNLSAPDSPRWNEYFVDLALALGATPVKRIGSRQLQLDAFLAGPPLKIAQIVFERLSGNSARLPDPIAPGLPRLWSQHIQLDSTRATQALGMSWTPYRSALKASVDWFSRNQTLLLAESRVYASTKR